VTESRCLPTRTLEAHQPPPCGWVPSSEGSPLCWRRVSSRPGSHSTIRPIHHAISWLYSTTSACGLATSVPGKGESAPQGAGISPENRSIPLYPLQPDAMFLPGLSLLTVTSPLRAPWRSHQHLSSAFRLALQPGRIRTPRLRLGAFAAPPSRPWDTCCRDRADGAAVVAAAEALDGGGQLRA
jgi:hypothetical protein